jgi:MoCo/4Fe-4S cofactor protein with predicted Tat translocation signal
MNSRKNFDSRFGEFRERIRAADNRTYWQCLEELADSAEFQQVMKQEFPALADVWPDALSRRKFLALMGASLGLAGIGGCSTRPAPQGTIASYARAPEEIIPGRPLFYATTMVHGGDAVGLLVESHEGRPTKIEGNPQHPASLGATNIFHQASVLTLYDPARSQTVVQGDRVRTWSEADAAIQATLAQQRERRGAGLRILTEVIVSPTLRRQIENLLKHYPEAKWHQYEPIHEANSRRASSLAFGDEANAVYDFRQADVVLSLDADFLTSGPGHLRYANEFMSRRRVRTSELNAANAKMNRLYVVEAGLTCTGAKADHRLAVRPSQVAGIAADVAQGLGIEGVPPGSSGKHSKWAAAVARDLLAHAERCVVIAGHRQPDAVHVLAHAMNDRLRCIGRTVRFIKPFAEIAVDPMESLRQLAADMEQGAVETLFILGGNPVYTSPVDVPFDKQLAKVRQSFHLSLYENATSRLCTWHLPEAHYLEAWSDARAFDGTASIAQPLIAPLYEGRSAHELLSVIDGVKPIDGRQSIQSYWREHFQELAGPAGFEELWQTALHDGVIANTASPASTVQLRQDWQSSVNLAGIRLLPSKESAQIEIAFESDPSIYDGRFVNNGWLQEVPKPITKLTWDNAALISPRTASDLGLKYGAFSHGGEHGGYDVPVVALRLAQRELRAPVWIVPGQPDGTVTLNLGYGQQYAAKANGQWQSSLGVNAYELRTSDQPWFATGVELIDSGETYPLACTQSHHLMGESRAIRSATLAEYREKPRLAVERDRDRHEKMVEQTRAAKSLPASQYEPFDYSRPQRKWGMSIDTTTCTGCSACVVACQAENNIPVVGKEQVRAGREMHWLRVDRYLHGEMEHPDEIYFQPVPCMHCEHAPCEYVCPVAATVHSAEGLNDMVYNRCVGTRFCSNNCPYKVRRFNFLEYADFKTVPLRLQYNPDVTVRSRGVMEKCTYCVQRIRHAEIGAESAQRPIRDGEVLTACQAACPSQAIVFGDMNDDQSIVKQWKESPLNYGLLEELNTFPRTTYLAALRNPNPELEGV